MTSDCSLLTFQWQTPRTDPSAETAKTRNSRDTLARYLARGMELGHRWRCWGRETQRVCHAPGSRGEKNVSVSRSRRLSRHSQVLDTVRLRYTTGGAALSVDRILKIQKQLSQEKDTNTVVNYVTSPNDAHTCKHDCVALTSWISSQTRPRLQSLACSTPARARRGCLCRRG